MNSLGLVSSPVTMHYAVFDKAGNARYYRQKMTVMNDAPAIQRVKLGAGIRNDAGLQTGWAALSNVTSSGLSKIRGGADETQDATKGISPWIAPATQLNSNTLTGAAHYVNNLNVRNKLFAVSVETIGKHGTGRERKFQLEYVTKATLSTKPEDI